MYFLRLFLRISLFALTIGVMFQICKNNSRIWFESNAVQSDKCQLDACNCRNIERGGSYVPSRISDVNRLSRSDRQVFRQRSYDFRKPLVFLAHARPLENSTSSVLLSLFTVGIDMPAFRRSFIAAGCRVGDDVFPVVQVRRMRGIKGPTHCIIPRSIRSGEHIGVVIERDEDVEKALDGPDHRSSITFESIRDDTYALQQPLRLVASLADKELNSFLGVKSRVTWNNQKEILPAEAAGDKPRYALCMVTMIKAYTNLIDDWVEYHRKLGVDMVYIYDNDSKENLEAKYEGRNDIEVVYWPWSTSQMQCFNHFYLVSVHRCQYAAYFDVDEYALIGIQSSSDDQVERGILKQYVSMLGSRGVTQMQFANIPLGNPGYLRIPENPLPEAYVYRQNIKKVKLGKSILKTSPNLMIHRIHHATGPNDIRYFNQTLDFQPLSLDDAAAVVHFKNRSWEERITKYELGFASIMGYMPNASYTIEKPDPVFMDGSSLIKYGFFQQVWKRVLKLGSNTTQEIVRQVGNLECRKIYEQP